MVPPAPTNPQVENSNESDLLGGVKSTSRFLRTFGFQLLAVLLGIALAFM